MSRKHEIPEDALPPVWDLSKLYPPFAGLGSPDKHKELADKIDSECQRLLKRIDNAGKTLQHPARQAFKPPFGVRYDALGQLRKDFDNAYRMSRWLTLYAQEFQARDDVHQFRREQQKKINDVYRALGDVSRLIPEKILNKNGPLVWWISEVPDLPPKVGVENKQLDVTDIEAIKEHEAANPPAEDGWMAVAHALGYKDNTPKSPNDTFDRLNSSAADEMGSEEARYVTASMYNTHIRQEWEEARQRNTTPWEDFAICSGLQDDFVPNFLEQREMLQEFSEENYRLMPLMKQLLKEEITFSWKEAVEITVASFAAIDPEFGKVARKALTEGQVHAKATSEKSAYAMTFSGNSYLIKKKDAPFAFIGDGVNENGRISLDGLSTIAHELGHVVSFYVKMHHKSHNICQDYTLSEAIGNLCSMRTLQQLHCQTDDPAKRCNISIQMLSEFSGDIHYNMAIREFEYALYKHYEDENAPQLSGKEIEDLFVQASQKYAPDEEVNLKQIAGIPQIFNDGAFNNFSYIPATLAVASLMEKLESQDGRKQWADIMRDTPPFTFADAMKSMGVETDIDTLCEKTREYTGMLWKQLENDLEAVKKQPWVGKVRSSSTGEVEQSR